MIRTGMRSARRIASAILLLGSLGLMMPCCTSQEEFPAAIKLSWAAKRETTRIEDMAYSLLGICLSYMVKVNVLSTGYKRRF
jgi:hypothetical protein